MLPTSTEQKGEIHKKSSKIVKKMRLHRKFHHTDYDLSSTRT